MVRSVKIILIIILCVNVNSFAQSINDTVFVSFVNNGKEKRLNSNFEIYLTDSLNKNINLVDVTIQDNYFTIKSSKDLCFKYVFFQFKNKLYYFGRTGGSGFPKINRWELIYFDNPDESMLTADENGTGKVLKMYLAHMTARPSLYVRIYDEKQHKIFLKEMKKIFKEKRK